jgi:hypothetical protein
LSEWIEILWGFAISWKYFEKQKSFISWRFAVPISGKDLIYKLLRNSSHLTLQNGPKWLMFETLHSSVIRPTFPTSIENLPSTVFLSFYFWPIFKTVLNLFKLFLTDPKLFFYLDQVQKHFSGLHFAISTISKLKWFVQG